MKCELCQKVDATTAIVRDGGDENDELYVCAACAKAEREKHQRKQQRTRKVTGLPPGVSMSITEISRGTGDDATTEDGDEPPAFLGALVNAFNDFVNDISGVKPKKESRQDEMSELPTGRVAAAFRVRGAIHLEGLHLLGELEAVRRGVHALGMELEGMTADGVRDAGHVYRFKYRGPTARAKRVVEDILREERNARTRLKDELPRVFSDSICRALAILKNCRLLSPGELFDLLSPLRLAAREKKLDGMTFDEIERLMSDQDLTDSEEALSQDERDRVDAERADEMNRRFEEVMFDDVL